MDNFKVENLECLYQEYGILAKEWVIDSQCHSVLGSTVSGESFFFFVLFFYFIHIKLTHLQFITMHSILYTCIHVNDAHLYI